jgi:hypothetical protein
MRLNSKQFGEFFFSKTAIFDWLKFKFVELHLMGPCGPITLTLPFPFWLVRQTPFSSIESYRLLRPLLLATIMSRMVS